jgi:type III secretion regulatory protein HpaA
MKVDGAGPNALQLLQAQADIEAANRPTPGLAAAQRHLSGRRAGSGHAAAPDAGAPDLVYAPLHHIRLAALQNKLRMRKARGAAGADAADSASEFEELLLMLESQAQTQAQTSSLPQIRVGRRRQEPQPDQHAGGHPPSPWPRAAEDRHAPTLRERQQQAVDRLVRDHVGARNGSGALDGAMRALHTLQSDPTRAVPLATAVLRITREFLAQPAAAGADKLADVRNRLLALLPPPSSRAAPALRQLHLLLPVLLLNAQRPRTSRQRALALAKIDVLLRGTRA